MKKFLILVFALCMMTFTYGCKKGTEKADGAKDTGDESKVIQAEDATPEVAEDTTDNTSTDNSEESSLSTDVSDVETPEDITDTDTLEALIDEFNDPNTSPERREELQILLGDFFDMMDGETVVVSE